MDKSSAKKIKRSEHAKILFLAGFTPRQLSSGRITEILSTLRLALYLRPDE